MKRLFPQSSNGDTIVEVLIVLAVLSLSFAISYSTANKGLQQSRNAEEHSQALGIVSSQVELLRSAYAQHPVTAMSAVPGPFCLPDSANPTTHVLATDASCTQGLYQKQISYTAAGDYFKVTVTWEGIGSLGQQKEDITYRISDIPQN